MLHQVFEVTLPLPVSGFLSLYPRIACCCRYPIIDMEVKTVVCPDNDIYWQLINISSSNRYTFDLFLYQRGSHTSGIITHKQQIAPYPYQGIAKCFHHVHWEHMEKSWNMLPDWILINHGAMGARQRRGPHGRSSC